MAFESSKWIWIDETGDDVHAEFYSELVAKADGALCRLSCDGDYTLFINGTYVASNQYGDFEHYKIYDELDLTPYLRSGSNDFALSVWHFGVPSSRYKPYRAGALFEVLGKNGELLLASSEAVLSRKSRTYASGRRKSITPQLGLSFAYDATRSDGWQTGGGNGFAPSTAVNKNCTLFPRPTERHRLLPERRARLIGKTEESQLFDLGAETVGYLSLTVEAEEAATLTVAYGEHLADGAVRRKIDIRDFSVEYRAPAGASSFTHYMLRLACRYLEVSSTAPVRIKEIGIIPVEYPTERKRFDKLPTERDRAIYELCLNTLELCMMEHYVDCPWREQCLYAFDSRNQMLAGYYAFRGGNRRYARANLYLISRDRRSDGLTSICYPCGIDLTIPAFSLYYLIAVDEYVAHTGDTALFAEVSEKLRELIATFLANREGGLVCRFAGKNHWNFYDWSEGSDGTLGGSEAKKPDAAINLLTLAALDSYERLCAACGTASEFSGVRRELAPLVRESFFDAEEGLFFMEAEEHKFTELVNSLAVRVGLASPDETVRICRKMSTGQLVPCSLAMKCFKYDAYLACREDMRAAVLDEIRSDYGKMLDAGSACAWETIDGESAFNKAGSLCHGWSAMPVYYYHKIFDT